MAHVNVRRVRVSVPAVAQVSVAAQEDQAPAIGSGQSASTMQPRHTSALSSQVVGAAHASPLWPLHVPEEH